MKGTLIGNILLGIIALVFFLIVVGTTVDDMVINPIISNVDTGNLTSTDAPLPTLMMRMLPFLIVIFMGIGFIYYYAHKEEI